MTDKNIRDDEEYKYPEEEYVMDNGQQATPEEAQPEEVREKPVSALKLFVVRNKRKLGVAAIAIIAIIVFQVMKYEKNNKVIKVQAAPAAQKVQQPSEAQVNHALLTQELSTLKQTGQANATTISNVQSQLQSMQTQLSQANQTNQQLKQAMVLLLGELKKVNYQLGQRPSAVKKKGPPKPVVTYHVRAMVNDRAWIVGSNGLTESVTVGDPVPNYGIVQSINANKGFITTSSGKVIKLGYNDF